MKQC